MQKSKTTVKTDVKKNKDGSIRKKPGPAKGTPRPFRTAMTQDKKWQAMENIAKAEMENYNKQVVIEKTRYHNFTKMIISAFNVQLQNIISNDTLMDETTSNDIQAIRIITSGMLRRWHLEKQMKIHGIEDTEAEG